MATGSEDSRLIHSLDNDGDLVSVIQGLLSRGEVSSNDDVLDSAAVPLDTAQGSTIEASGSATVGPAAAPPVPLDPIFSCSSTSKLAKKGALEV